MNKIGISQKAIILNREGKLLAIRRSETAPTNSLYWDLPGGDLEFGEDPMRGIIREVKEETGLTVNDPELFDIEAHISNNEFWVTIAYLLSCGSEVVNLSYEHDKFKWVTADDFLQLKSADKLKRFVKKLIKLNNEL